MSNKPINHKPLSKKEKTTLSLVISIFVAGTFLIPYMVFLFFILMFGDMSGNGQGAIILFTFIGLFVFLIVGGLTYLITYLICCSFDKSNKNNINNQNSMDNKINTDNNIKDVEYTEVKKDSNNETKE